MSILTILCAIYLAFDLREIDNLISLLGLGVFILICIFLSEHPGRVLLWSLFRLSYLYISNIIINLNYHKVNFYTLTVGILIQFILGVFILRSEFGYQLFKFLGAEISNFLDYTDNGCRLVFGDSFADHFFAFKVNLNFFFNLNLNRQDFLIVFEK